MKNVFALLCTLMVITACGTDDAGTADADIGSSADGQESAATAAGAGAATPLPTTPIKVADAMGRTPPSITETGPCPFLSDETALATANSQYEMVRRRVSNTECVWNYNIGFQVSARVEPIATSRPFSDRTYNMDVPAVLQPASAPGRNAVVLADSTFGAPRPFAFGFEQDDKRVTIYITGMRTSQPQLQAAAEEIARRLPDAPQIEPQERVETGAFDPCAIWSDGSLRTLLSQPDSAVVSTVPSSTSCTYTVYFSRPSRNVETIGVNIFDGDPNIVEFLQGKGWNTVSGAAYPTVSQTTTDQFGVNAQMRATIHGADVAVTVRDQDGNTDTAEAALKALFTNLAARAVP